MADSKAPIALPPTDRAQFRIAVICALPEEARMVIRLLDRNWTQDGKRYGKAPSDSNSYTYGLMAGYNVVIAHMPEEGGTAAAQVAAHLKHSFGSVEIAFVVGICGIMPKHPETGANVNLGDIIVGMGVIRYQYGRLTSGGFVRKTGPNELLGRPKPQILG